MRSQHCAAAPGTIFRQPIMLPEEDVVGNSAVDVLPAGVVQAADFQVGDRPVADHDATGMLPHTPIAFRNSSGKVLSRLSLDSSDRIDLGHVPLRMSRNEAAAEDRDDDSYHDEDHDHCGFYDDDRDRDGRHDDDEQESEDDDDNRDRSCGAGQSPAPLPEPNPTPDPTPTPTPLDGQSLYSANCGACHSNPGRFAGISATAISSVIRSIPSMNSLSSLSGEQLLSIADFLATQ